MNGKSNDRMSLTAEQCEAVANRLIFCKDCMFWSQWYGDKYDATGRCTEAGEYGQCTRLFSSITSQNPGTIHVVAHNDFCSFGVSVIDSRGHVFVDRFVMADKTC